MNPACGKCPRRVNRADEPPCAGCRLRRAWSSTLTQLRGSFVMGISVKVPEAPQQVYSDLLEGRVWQTPPELFPSLVMKGKRPSYLCPLEKQEQNQNTRMKKSLSCIPTGFMALLHFLGDSHLLTPYHLRIIFKTKENHKLPDLPAAGFQKSLFRPETWWDLHKNEKFLWICLLLFSFKFCFPSCHHPSPLFSGLQDCKAHLIPECLQIYHCDKGKRIPHRVVFLRCVLLFSYNERSQGAWEYLKRKSQRVPGFLDVSKYVPWEHIPERPYEPTTESHLFYISAWALLFTLHLLPKAYILKVTDKLHLENYPLIRKLSLILNFGMAHDH